MRLFSRRALLWGSAGTLAAVAALGAGSLVACNRRLADAGLDPAEAATRLAEALDEVFAPARLAAHWGDDGAPAALLDALRHRPRIREALATDCPATRRALLRAEIRDDFAAGDICLVDRLVVSRTEAMVARLCVRAA
jgi:hypothetical protein